MNCNTGDLYKHYNLVPEDLKKDVIPVPDQYEVEAQQLLAEQEHVKVDMNKSTPLIDWAKKQQSKKKRRQMAKASRKANRRK